MADKEKKNPFSKITAFEGYSGISEDSFDRQNASGYQKSEKGDLNGRCEIFR